jgi:very-short-patch-repair endonuclease
MGFERLNFTTQPVRGPLHEPPYDSPIENIFAYHIIKHLGEGAQFDRQVEIDTQCGTFRIDFVCTSGGRTVGFECDGQEYHEEARDRWRDALIMGTGRVNAIYRIAGRNIHYHIDQALYLISLYESMIFNERGLTNLRVFGEADKISVERSESNAILKYRWCPEKLKHLLDDQDLCDQAWRPVSLSIAISTDRRFHEREPDWHEKVQFACCHVGKSLEQIMNLFSRDLSKPPTVDRSDPS